MYLKEELYGLIRTDESIFDFIQESALDGLWYWDLENPENEWMNPKFWTVLGYNPAEMPHKSGAWQNIINQDDLILASDNLTKHCENPDHPYDQIVRYTHKDGSTVWIRCRGLAIRDKNGKPIRMLGAHQDVTELKRSEQELLKAHEKVRESEERYRAFYNNTPLSYQSLDENGCFIDINPMWSKTLGYERDEVIGKWYGDFLHPDFVEHFRINFPAFKKRGYVSNVQFKLRRKDNTYIHVSFEGCVGYTPEGKFRQTYCVFKDITEQKQKEIKEEVLYQIANASLVSEDVKALAAGIKILLNKLIDTTNFYIAFYDKENDMFSIPYEADEKDQIETFRANKSLTGLVMQKGKALLLKKPEVLELMESGEIEQIGTKSEVWLGVPLFAGSEIIGVLAVQDYHNPDTYDKGSKEILEFVSSQISMAFQRSKFNEYLLDAKQKAEESEQRFKSLIENAPDGVVIMDETGKFKYVSPNALRLFGFKKDEVIGRSGDENTHPDDLPLISKTIETILTDPRQKPTVKYRFKRKDGEFRWIETTFTNLLSDKAINGIILNFTDVTEKKQIFEELVIAKDKAEESEERFNLAMKASNDGLFDWNLETHEIYYSPGWKKMLGYEDNELPNDFSVWENRTDPVDVKKSWELQQKLISKQIDRFVMEFKMQHKDGHWIDILSRAEAIFNDSGEAVRIVGTHTDISQGKQAEETLKNRENLLNKVFDILPIGLWFADANGRLVRGNPAGVKIWGAEPTVSIEEYGVFKARRHPSGEEIEPDDWALVHTIREGVTIEDEQLEIDTFDGKKKIILNYTAPVLDDQGNIQGAIIVNQDITERKQAEEKLRRTNLDLETAKEIAEESEAKQRKLSENLKQERILLRTIVDSIPDAIHVKDLEYRKVLANKADCQNCGLEKEEDVIGKTDFDVFPVELAERLLDDDKKVVKDGISLVNREECLKNTNYNEKWLLTSKLPLYDDTGKIIGLVGIGRDITERKNKEEKIREKDLQFRKLSANVPDLIFQFTRRPDGTYYVPVSSEGIKNIFGCSPEDVIDDFAPIARVILPEDSERVFHDIEYSAKHLTYFTCEFRVQIPGKPVQWILSRSTPEKLPDGSITWFGFNADITERKKAEKALMVKMDELERFFKLTVGREITMVELKKEVNYLLNRLGEDNKYKIVE